MERGDSVKITNPLWLAENGITESWVEFPENPSNSLKDTLDLRDLLEGKLTLLLNYIVSKQNRKQKILNFNFFFTHWWKLCFLHIPFPSSEDSDSTSVSFEALLPQWGNFWEARVSNFHSPVVSSHRRWKRSFVIAAKTVQGTAGEEGNTVKGRNKAAQCLAHIQQGSGVSQSVSIGTSTLRSILLALPSWWGTSQHQSRRHKLCCSSFNTAWVQHCKKAMATVPTDTPPASSEGCWR